ncbi:MAG: hypothetical protein IPH64_17645 [Comamonadaceae bacterium]|nr:hypothetical protein [Comamonadaceae bacterium]
MQSVRLAWDRKRPPKLAFGDLRPVAMKKHWEAALANRYDIMAGVCPACASGTAGNAHAEGPPGGCRGGGAARRWLHRDTGQSAGGAPFQLSRARSANAVLDKMVVMREELRQVWLNTSHSREQLAVDLQAWCRRAERWQRRVARIRCASGRARADDFTLTRRPATGVPCVWFGQATKNPLRKRVLVGNQRRITSAWFPCIPHAFAPWGRTS